MISRNYFEYYIRKIRMFPASTCHDVYLNYQNYHHLLLAGVAWQTVSPSPSEEPTAETFELQDQHYAAAA